MGMRSGWRAWVDDDFVDKDTLSKRLVEPDPWEPVESLTVTLRNRDVDEIELEAPVDDTVDVSEPYDLVDEPTVDVRSEAGSYDGTEEVPPDWDEPEPMVDADSDLSESLYPPDNSVTDLSLELKIGELLVHVSPMAKQQREHCLELLKACGLGILRRLLPWLRDRTWNGTQLQLFLELRKHWGAKANVRWWETFLWSEAQQRWMPRYQRETLTLSHARVLVKWRSHYTVKDVIDNEWYWDWDSSAPWESGIRSFADFAVFRAGIPHNENWREYLVRRDDRSTLEIDQCLDPTFAPFMLPSYAEQYGLSTKTDPWPQAWELVEARAHALGGDVAHAWYETVNGSTNA